jgi:hypothetical protein
VNYYCEKSETSKNIKKKNENIFNAKDIIEKILNKKNK